MRGVKDLQGSRYFRLPYLLDVDQLTCLQAISLEGGLI
jgi:hypothetical protein